MTGKLIIVPTPIGNLGDISSRALDALRSADVVCAEDTRVTGKLLAAFCIEGKRLERLDENALGQRAESVIQRITAGETVAYCSDAGMPGVSDPGLRLVAAAHEAEVPVEVLPGPSAVATAYVASGFTCSNFYFGGFFPRKDTERHALCQKLAGLDAALIFYESPNRLVDTLNVITDEFPLRQIAVCRELTKLHEEVVCGTTTDVRDEFAERDSIKGEIVVVIDTASYHERQLLQSVALQSAQERADELLDAGERPKSIAHMLAEEFGIARNDAYDLVLSLKSRQKD